MCALAAGLVGGGLAQSDECAVSSAAGFDFEVGLRISFAQRVSVFAARVRLRADSFTAQINYINLLLPIDKKKIPVFASVRKLREIFSRRRSIGSSRARPRGHPWQCAALAVCVWNWVGGCHMELLTSGSTLQRLRWRVHDFVTFHRGPKKRF